MKNQIKKKNIRLASIVKGQLSSVQRGLTLIELVVVIGIMAVLMAITLANYPEFGGAVSLNRVAQEIGLSIRQAQAYGLGVREITGTQQYPPYGIYFSSPNEFILFADTNNGGAGNGLYDPGDGCGSANTECVESYQLDGKNFISQLCTLSPSGDCDQVVQDLSITFKRPEPEAYVHTSATPDSTFNGARIKLTSKKYPNKQQFVRVWITGQISVQGQ